MRLLVHDTLAAAPMIEPFAAGWVAPGPDLTVVPAQSLTAPDVGADDVALLPAPEIARLQETHHIVPDVALVADGRGAVALRTPVRPDEVERTPVRLLDVSSAAEFLARATLRPFYGIEAASWLRADSDPGAAGAQAVVVEGAAALLPPEAGFSEDLCRAWFVLTGLPAVTHLLVAPLAADRDALAPLLRSLDAARAAADVPEHRRAWHAALAERHDLSRETIRDLFARQRLALDADDRPALLQLFQRAPRPLAYPPLTSLRFLDPTPT